MKTHITFKTPDALSDAAREAAATAHEKAKEENLSEDEVQEAADAAFDKVMEVGEKFIRSGELITIELDLEAGTAKVLKA